MKEDKDVIAEFNEYVNVTASELDKWLQSEDSSKAGWHKDGGDGESVGQDSGHKIVEILKSNPDKNPEKYTGDQIQHMRKVASYCKRHLAQESKGLKEKDPDEVKKTKSYLSLMNWGHNPLKALGEESVSSGSGGSKTNVKRQNVEEGEEEEEYQNGDEAEEDDKKAGNKRKKFAQPNSANKKRETSKGEPSKQNNTGDEEDGQGDDDYEEGDSGNEAPKNELKKGETVSWNWGSGHPQGKVLDVKEGDATITTKRGNKVSRKGNPEDPAVILDAGKSKAIKLAHELN